MTEASAPPMAAAPDVGKCEALYDAYVKSLQREDQLFKVVLLLVFATAVLVIIAVLMVLTDMQDLEVGSGAIALVSSIGAGAMTTMYWRTHKETIARLNAWATACPDRVGSTLARGM
jgi:hypothetical protein